MPFSELCRTDASLGRDLASIYTSLRINWEALGNTESKRKKYIYIVSKREARKQWVKTHKRKKISDR